MKTLLTALVPAVITLTGCLCGGWEGGNDTVMRTDSGDAMQLCSNGGYSVMLANGTLLEGHLGTDNGAIAGSIGETGARGFTLSDQQDGTQSSPELGAGWKTITLDQVELDHAHVQCADLETRPWWTSSSACLPTETAFSRTTYGVTEEIRLCADGTARVPSITGEPEITTYTSEAGMISVYGSLTINGIYLANGTLAAQIPGQASSVWTRTVVVAGQGCR